MHKIRLFGTYTALVTPFRSDSTRSVDWEALDSLVEAQVSGKVEGIVPCGTTGESPTLSHEEHMEVIRRTVARVKGRVQVIAGTGSNSTHEAVALSQAAEKAGADAVMVVVPYYNRPTQEGLVVHFQTVAAAINLPVVLYNIPGRTGTDLSADTVARLCELSPNIVGIKEATGNVLRAQELKRRLGNRLTVLSGDDALTLPMIAVGASGVISVTSNLLPEAVGNATRLALDGKFSEAQTAHFALLPVHESMFVEANPGPVKAALADMGLAIDAVRSPLVAASDKSRQTVRQALASYKSGK